MEEQRLPEIRVHKHVGLYTSSDRSWNKQIESMKENMDKVKHYDTILIQAITVRHIRRFCGKVTVIWLLVHLPLFLRTPVNHLQGLCRRMG